MQRAVGHVEQQNRLLVEAHQRLEEDAAEGVVFWQRAAVSTCDNGRKDAVEGKRAGKDRTCRSRRGRRERVGAG